MTWTPRRWMWLLLCAGLTTCATAQPSVIGDAEAQGEIASFEELCAEEESLLPLCIGPQCGLYRCREVMAQLEDKVQIEQLAGQLIADFMLYGLVIPYRQRLWKTPPLGSY